MKLINKLILGVGLAVVIGSNAVAFDLKVPKVGGDSSSSSVDVGALTNQQTDLVKTLSASLLNLSQSQALMATALGLKGQASISEQNAGKLKSGELTGKDDIDKTVTSALEVNKAIENELKKGTKLSEESKAQFASALLPYAKGSVGMIVTAKKAAEIAKSLTTTTDLTVLTKLSSLIYIAKQAPSFISTFTGTTSQVISFSKTNGIDTTSFEKSATSSMGE